MELFNSEHAVCKIDIAALDELRHFVKLYSFSLLLLQYAGFKTGSFKKNKKTSGGMYQFRMVGYFLRSSRVRMRRVAPAPLLENSSVRCASGGDGEGSSVAY